MHPKKQQTRIEIGRTAVEEAGRAVLLLEGGEVALLGGRLEADHAGAVEHTRARDCIVGFRVWFGLSLACDLGFSKAKQASHTRGGGDRAVGVRGGHDHGGGAEDGDRGHEGLLDALGQVEGGHEGGRGADGEGGGDRREHALLLWINGVLLANMDVSITSPCTRGVDIMCMISQFGRLGQVSPKEGFGSSH